MGHRAGSRSRDRGLALVLVMMVILALAIIATPFVLSMLLQERTGTVSRYASQADYGTEGVRNYALWRLMYGVEHVERRMGGGGGMGPSWHYDIEQEFEVRIDDNTLSQNGDILDPKGSIWGLDIQDEQGKIDVRTAPRHLIARVRRMVEDKLVDRKDYLTMYAGRDATWLYPQRIRAFGGQGTALLGKVGDQGIGLDNPYLFGKGARVRLSKASMPPVYGEVSQNGLASDFGKAFTTDANAGGYLNGVVEVEQRHPVNINTAKPETLTALFAGLSLVNEPDSIVDGSAAMGVARLFAGKRTESMADFLNKLQSASLAPRQRHAIELNAIAPTHWRLDGSGTMPLCFATYDTYTVEAFASQNNPAGATMASRGFREVVSVSPPAILSRFCESQYDFDRMIFARSTMNPTTKDSWSLYYYPFGYKLSSFPNLFPIPPPQPMLSQPLAQQPATSDLQLKPQPPGREAYVRSKTGVDQRGWGSFEGPTAESMGWKENPKRLHYHESQEGRELKGSSIGFPWAEVFVDLSQSGGGIGGRPPNIRPSVEGGGLEMWVRFDSVSNPEQLFDIREEEYTNRLGLRIDTGEMLLQASDGTINCPDQNIKLEHGAALVRQPEFTPEDKTWYHFGAYWMGTELGGLALLVDGFAHPLQTFEYVNEEGDRIDTTLSGGLAPSATSIALADPSWIPDNQVTALQIGAEVVLYDKTAGTLLRGARRTQEANHPDKARVRPFGYSSKIKVGEIVARANADQNNPGWTVRCDYPRLTTGGGKLLFGFGGNPLISGPIAVTTDGTQQDPNMRWFIDATERDIPVNEIPGRYTIMDFPDQGYIKIDGEIIFYTGRSAGGVNGRGTAKFTGCTRGEYGAASQHFMGRPVVLWSIATDNNAQYLDPTILLVGDEFFGPVQKCQKRQGYWIPPIDYVQPQGVLFGNGIERSRLQSIKMPHNPAEVVSPTFLAADSLGYSRLNMGRDDWVTLTEASNLKEPAQVRQSGPNLDLRPIDPNDPNQTRYHYDWGRLRATTPQSNQNGLQLVGLYAPTAREYTGDDLHVRALKFPSGELLSLTYVQGVDPQFTVGPMNTTIDEVKIYASVFENPVVGQELSDSGTSLVAGGRVGGLSRFGGLMKIGGEFIGYVSREGRDLDGLKRGWLHSAAEVHDAGDPIFNLYMIPVTSLATGMSATDTSIRLNQDFHRQRTPRYLRGYLLIDEEILAFESNGDLGQGNGPELRMPARWDGTTGLYRGMFGTQPASHSNSDALVYGIPWRYFDTYKEREFDNTMSYFQWSTRMPDARWHDIRIVTEVDQGDPNLVVHALVRVDGKGDFWDPPAMDGKTLLLEFVNGTGGKVDRTGYQNDAGQIDVRFYTEYKQGAFNPQEPWTSHSWKRAAKIKEIQIDYDRPTRTLYHEDK